MSESLRPLRVDERYLRLQVSKGCRSVFRIKLIARFGCQGFWDGQDGRLGCEELIFVGV